MRTELHYGSLDSTLAEYARLETAGAAGTGLVIRADTQTAGKGRNGNLWQSPNGGLWLTFDLHHSNRVPSFALYVGYCLHSLLLRLFALPDLKIKWPNDIYLGEAKLAGILCESREINSRYVIGIGINTNVIKHEVSLPIPIAILSDCLGVTVSNTTLAVLLVQTVRQQATLLDSPPVYIDYCNSCLYGRDSWAELENCGQMISGTIAGIASDGSLVLRAESGDERLAVSGSLHIPTPERAFT